MLSMLRLWSKLRNRCSWQARAAELPAARLAERMASRERFQIVDSRGAEAFAGGHLPGVVNLPLGELLARIAELDRAAPTVVY